MSTRDPPRDPTQQTINRNTELDTQQIVCIEPVEFHSFNMSIFIPVPPSACCEIKHVHQSDWSNETKVNLVEIGGSRSSQRWKKH